MATVSRQLTPFQRGQIAALEGGSDSARVIRATPPPEYVLCAAIWIDTGKAEPERRSYTYPATGIVFGGWRHSDCYVAVNAWVARLTDTEREIIGEEGLHGRHQGFITSIGRFVDRDVAGRLAFTAGQVDRDGLHLTSEDLY